MQNKYEVLGVVGEGAYGIVYKCKNKQTGEYVAIKKFKETEDELVKKTMKRELRVLQLLKHENIVEFKEAFKRKNNLFLVFEFVERNLLELLQERPSGLDQGWIRNWIYQLCKAVDYLHSQNIIHRDVKPENLLIGGKNNDILKWCDFGFARKVKNNKTEELTDYVATRWYRSPELLITGGIYGPEIDYWAIGCIMGEWVDGVPLFPGESEIDQLHCIQKIWGNFPQEWNDLFYKNPIYDGNSWLNVQKPETWERRYLGKLNKVGISFMKELMELDPDKRWIGEKVYQHPYFACFMEGKETESTVNVNTKDNNSSEMLCTVKKPAPSDISNVATDIPVDKNSHKKPNNTNKDNTNGPTNINIVNYNTYTTTKHEHYKSNSPNDRNNNQSDSHRQVPPPNIEKQFPTIQSHNTHEKSDNNNQETESKIVHIKKLKNKSEKSSMAMTMTNKFPSKFKTSLIGNKEVPNVNLTARQSMISNQELGRNKQKGEDTGNLTFDTLLKNKANALVGGYNTHKKKDDQYNFSINTHFTSFPIKENNTKMTKNTSNSHIIEEEPEEKIGTKKSQSLTQKKVCYKQKNDSWGKDKSNYVNNNYMNNALKKPVKSISPYQRGYKNNMKKYLKKPTDKTIPNGNLSCYNIGTWKDKGYGHGNNSNITTMIYLPNWYKNMNNKMKKPSTNINSHHHYY